jgi:hypothetical protein
MCTNLKIKIKDVSGLVIIMYLVDQAFHMVIGLYPLYTFVLHGTSILLVAFICHLVYAVLSLHEVLGLSRVKQLGVFVNVSFLFRKVALGEGIHPCQAQFITVGIIST